MFEEIRNELIEMSDKRIAEFSAKLCPNVNSDKVLGIKIPELRKIAKRIVASGDLKNI